MHHAKSKRVNERKESMQQDAELRALAMIHNRCGRARSRLETKPQSGSQTTSLFLLLGHYALLNSHAPRRANVYDWI